MFDRLNITHKRSKRNENGKNRHVCLPASCPILTILTVVFDTPRPWTSFAWCSGLYFKMLQNVLTVCVSGRPSHTYTPAYFREHFSSSLFVITVNGVKNNVSSNTTACHMQQRTEQNRTLSISVLFNFKFILALSGHRSLELVHFSKSYAHGSAPASRDICCYMFFALPTHRHLWTLDQSVQQDSGGLGHVVQLLPFLFMSSCLSTHLNLVVVRPTSPFWPRQQNADLPAIARLHAKAFRRSNCLYLWRSNVMLYLRPCLRSSGDSWILKPASSSSYFPSSRASRNLDIHCSLLSVDSSWSVSSIFFLWCIFQADGLSSHFFR